MMGIVLLLLLALPPCDAADPDRAAEIRAVSGHEAGIRHLETRMRGCTPDAVYMARVANRWIEWSETDRGEAGARRLGTAFAWARRAATADPGLSLAQEILATAYGARIGRSSLLTQAALGDSVRIHAERAVRLDPRNPRAHHILGRWHFEVASLPWYASAARAVLVKGEGAGTYALAVRHFGESARLRNDPDDWLWTARAAVAAGDQRQARLALDRLAAHPAPKSPAMQDEIRRLRRQLAR